MGEANDTWPASRSMKSPAVIVKLYSSAFATSYTVTYEPKPTLS